MKIQNSCLTNEEILIIKSLIGKVMIKYRHDEFLLGKDIIVGNAEFFIGNKVYAVTNYPHFCPFFGQADDVCDIRFKEIEAEYAKSYCLDTQQIDFPLEKKIKDIIVANDKIDQYKGKELLFTYLFTRAIIFVFDDVQIGFEKDNWMQELIIVKKGTDIVSRLQDPNAEFSDWDCEDIKSTNTRKIFSLKEN